ncbi:SDR family NAD(P)-dependent oxidoreductase [Streptomonospora sp. PA3]|uniref:SDR family NAD(P)-dependent oxidoreductase n=1 Tax=Streptomonospora sp. PA3 TaxID=2607326 RepID=UPI0012DF6CBC|nr:SDR family NAD(P)-dependent oxidoreductase [Streptomonospora sp. PA3]MUL41056.1 SDR family NAD(P)-dependent oxidoreductase [Streptomonospora sp. PA3]
MVNPHHDGTHPDASARTDRTVVVTGGTDGMGRAVVLGRAARGDRVLAVGSNPRKGERLLADAAASELADRIEFLAADLSTLAGNRAVIDHVTATYESIDGLVLAANRQSPRRVETSDGFESTFALYYLSRYLLGHGLISALSAGSKPVIVNIAGVGLTSGKIHWDDLRMGRRYLTIAAQLQAGRANDLLGVAMAAEFGEQVPYVLYHPGFTRSGDSAMEQVGPLTRAVIKTVAAIAARSVERAIAPVHAFLDSPPRVPLTAVDRDKPVPLDLKTLDPADAKRLAEATSAMLAAAEPTADPREDGLR